MLVSTLRKNAERMAGLCRAYGAHFFLSLSHASGFALLASSMGQSDDAPTALWIVDPDIVAGQRVMFILCSMMPPIRFHIAYHASAMNPAKMRHSP
jgi:hypothetical protein